MTDDNDSASPNHQKPRTSTFVRRLIPTVAAATLTFGCPPPENNGNNGNNGSNMGTNSDTNSGTNSDTNAGNAGTNNTNNGANAGTNNTANSSTNSATNAGTNSGTNSETNSGTNSGTNNLTVTDKVEVDGDGTISTQELEAFCQGWEDCNPGYFAESYDTVEDCVDGLSTTIEEQIQYYVDDYGQECGDVVEARGECLAGVTGCGSNGYFTYTAEDGDACYAEFDEAYMEYCY